MSKSGGHAALSVEELVGRVADEFIEALDRGERPEVEEVVRRHPEYAAVLRDVLTAILAMQPAPGETTDRRAPTDPARCLGDFRIIREVGRGGMGVVYEAEQISLSRRVALKVLPFAAALDARQLQRFRNEAQAAAHLHHTNIVPVYAVGCDRGTHYYAMQFIDGQNLAGVIRGHGSRPDRAAPPPCQETPVLAALTTARATADLAYSRTVARLGIQAAEALEHAHQLGIVHRDVKPANLMVDTGGHLWVTDFGLARLQNDAGLTLSGDLLGTLAYMSPEQARGQHGMVDHRTDIYSLGASLYELLSLAPPFRAADRAGLLRAIAEDEPAAPHWLNRAIPAELETIVLKALAKAPAERYASAQALADDLRRFLDDKPILARRPTVGQRLGRWARRNRGAVRAAAAAAVVTTLAIVIGLAVGIVTIRSERDRAQTAERERTHQLYNSLVAQAQASRLAGGVGSRADAQAALAEAAKLAPRMNLGPNPLLRLRNEVIATYTMTDVRVEAEWEGHPAGTRAVAFDSELRRYARCEADGTITVRKVLDDSEEARLDRAVTLPGNYFLKFSRDGAYLAVWVKGHLGNAGAVWDLARRTVRRSFDGTAWMDFGSASRLAVCRPRDALRVVDLGTDREESPRAIPIASADRFYFDAKGQKLAVCRPGARQIDVWDLSTSDPPRRLSLPGPIDSLAWHPTGRSLAVGSGRAALVWELDEAKPRLTLIGHLSEVIGLAFSPDGGLLATTSWDQTLRLWDPRSGRQLLAGPGSSPLQFASDGRLAFTNGTRLVVARTAPPDGVRALHEPSAEGNGPIAIGPHDLLAINRNHGVRFWDLPTGSEAGFLPVGRPTYLAFDPAGRYLLTAGDSKSLARWPIDREPGGRLGFGIGDPELIPYPAGRPEHLSFTRDGRTLITSVGNEVFVHDWPEAAIRLRLRGPSGLWMPEVSSDGRWIATGCWHGPEMQVRDSRTGAIAHRLTFPLLSGCRVGFSPDDRWLVMGTAGEYVAFETETWRRAWAISRNAAGEHPGVMAFSPDGRLLAVADSPTLVKLYRAGSAEEIATLPAPDPQMLVELAFSPDGSRLAANTEGNRAFVWDLRAIRAELSRLGLDWALPDYPPAESDRSAARVVQTRPEHPWACNALAWFLSTGPAERRDPSAALPLAETAACLNPAPHTLNTLGAVYFRLGRWADAEDALTRSVALQGHGGTAYDHFFLAMCEHRLGKRQQARTAYDRAVRWMNQNRSEDNELNRLRAETEALIER
jgi:WD40 repeat protein/tRNA A-37 threonylcarbamoyl transferase component Bud32